MSNVDKRKKQSAVISADAFYYIFFGESMLDDDNMVEAEQFKANNPDISLISYSVIPDDYRVVIFYEKKQKWTHIFNMTKFWLCWAKFTKDTIEFEIVNTYEDKNNIVYAGIMPIHVNKFGLDYFSLPDSPRSRLYLREFSKI